MLRACQSHRDCGLGVCNPWRGWCECPVGWRGASCEQSLLPSCVLPSGGHLPVRSWVLHAFHNGPARDRWDDRSAIGPVACECLADWVAAPFLLERSRLNGMRGWTAPCISLAESGSAGGASSFAEVLARPSSAVWRRFSFAAAHDTLRLGLTPSLASRNMDEELPAVAAVLAPLRQRAAQIRAVVDPADATAADSCLLAEPPRLLLNGSAPPLPLLPLGRCPRECGGRGWCEPVPAPARRRRRPWLSSTGASSATAAARCGCFLAGGLRAGVGGPACDEELPRRAAGPLEDGAAGPAPHWGPACPARCSARGTCDWQGFCNCDVGYWGLDCALRLAADGSPEAGRVVVGKRIHD